MRGALRALQLPSWQALCAALQPSAGVTPILTLADVLNPLSPVHHPAFAERYRALRSGAAGVRPRRAPADPEDADEAAGPTSALSVADHAWYLGHQESASKGALAPADAARFEHLTSLLPLERQLYAAVTLAGLRAHAERYAHCTGRQAAQIEADLALRRRLLVFERLPRFVRCVLDIEADLAGAGSVEQPALRPRASPGDSQDTHVPPTISAIPAGTKLPGQLNYLPKVAEEASRRPSKAFRKTLAVVEALRPGTGGVADADEIEDEQGSHDRPCEVVWTGAALRAVLADAGPWEIPLDIELGRMLFGKPLPPRGGSHRRLQARLQRAAVLTAGAVDGSARAARTSRWALGDQHHLTLVSRSALVLESPEAAQIEDRGPATDPPLPVALAVRTEYAARPDRERVSDGDLANWAVKLLLSGTEELVEVAVHVPTATVLGTRRWRTQEIDALGGAALRARLGRGRAMLRGLLSALGPDQGAGARAALPPGQYIAVGGRVPGKAFVYAAAAPGIVESLQQTEGVRLHESWWRGVIMCVQGTLYLGCRKRS